MVHLASEENKESRSIIVLLLTTCFIFICKLLAYFTWVHIHFPANLSIYILCILTKQNTHYKHEFIVLVVYSLVSSMIKEVYSVVDSIIT